MSVRNLLILALLLALVSCQEQLFDDASFLQNESTINLRSASNQNNAFDWENLRTVHFEGVDRVLPWYSGAMGGLPYYIISDYKKEDGWVMVYNFLTEFNAERLNTVIFYNKFRGILRVFYYNTRGITNGGATFAQLLMSDANTRLLNNLTASGYALALDQIGSNVAYTTNINSIAGIAIGHGWNCFDFELTYDNNITQSKKTTFSLNYFDRKVDKITINGQLISIGELSYITTSNSNPWGDSVNTVFGAIATASGNEVGKLVQRQNNNAAETRFIDAIIGSAISAVISTAINAASKSWTSSWGKTEQTYKTISMKMASDVKLEGNSTSTMPSPGTSIQSLALPGSSTLDTDILPIYNDPLGVWNIRTIKPFRVNSHYIQTLEVINGNYHDPDATDLQIRSSERLEQFHPRYTKSDIVINPSTLAHISDYTVSSRLYVIRNNSKEQTFEEWKNTYKNNYHTLYNGMSSTQYFDWLTWEFIRMPAPAEFFNGDLKFVTKITVQLYPKAPYSADIIESVRTFETKVEKINIPNRARPERM